jgi:hypothetical protein
MKYLKRLWKNALSSYQLKEEYYKLTSRVGLLVVFLAWGLMLYGVFSIASLLGIDTSVPMGKGYSFLALILLPIIYIISIIPTVLIVVGITSVYLISKGEITTEQGKKYTLFGEYPSHWFKNT